MCARYVCFVEYLRMYDGVWCWIWYTLGVFLMIVEQNGFNVFLIIETSLIQLCLFVSF